MTVASPMLKIPKGNSTMRSARYSHVTLPSARQVAMAALIMTLICPMEEPTMAGSISLPIRCTPSCLKFQRGLRNNFNFNNTGK